ncbi:MAG: CADD family putative folate metabolism protein [Chlamydiales bacterium]|nr:CADD family putative folate metabolism protein [Chlamydiales bacterium]
MNDTESYLNNIDQQIANKHLLSHPFYQAWTRGELTKECLAEYAAQYYHHVKAFPTYLSALHAHTEEAHTRRELLQNLIEEEAGTPNHPDLWKAFGEALSFTEQASNDEIQALINTFRDICHNGSVAEGLAALYAYESQIPAVSESKIHGLKQHYDMTNPKDWRYFTVHIEADKEHAAVERKLLAQYVNAENHQAVQASVQKVLDRLWDFLTGLCERYEIACAM